METKYEPKVGDTVVVNDSFFAVIASREKSAMFLLNTYDKETFEPKNVTPGNYNVRLCSTEERRRYWDFITHLEGTNEGVYNEHCNDEDAIIAGTAIVLGNKYITITGTDIPRYAREQIYFACYTYNLKTWQKYKLPLTTEVTLREATEQEKVALFDKIMTQNN